MFPKIICFCRGSDAYVRKQIAFVSLAIAEIVGFLFAIQILKRHLVLQLHPERTTIRFNGIAFAVPEVPGLSVHLFLSDPLTGGGYHRKQFVVIECIIEEQASPTCAGRIEVSSKVNAKVGTRLSIWPVI